MTSIAPLKRVGSTAQRLSEKPYEKRLCRIESHYPPPPDPGGKQTVSIMPEEYVDVIDDCGYEVIVISGEHNRGTPRFTSNIFAHHPELKDDMLPRFIELCHEKGIIVLSYYPIIFSKPLRAVHPEWLMQFLDDGRPEPMNEGWFCFNSPFRDWLPGCLHEYMEQLDIDGRYFDDVNWGSHADGPYTPSCCCSYCEKLFRDETGFEVPRKIDFESKDFRHFVNWRYKKLTEFLHHLFGSVRRQYPDAILDMNTYYWPGSEWSQGHPLGSFSLEKVGGYSFVECFPYTHRYLRTPSFAAKVLRATGTPFSLFLNGCQGMRGFSSVPYPEAFGESIFGMIALAHGGGTCGAPFGGSSVHEGYLYLTRDGHKQMFSEIKKRVDYVEAESLKYLALHCSTQNRDFQPNEICKDVLARHNWIGYLRQKFMFGAYEMLNRSQIPLDFVLDDQLVGGHLSAYQTLFLSNSACLSTEQCDAITGFVENGGTLIATHETSLFDEMGYERENFALAELLGVDFVGRRHNAAEHGVVYLQKDRQDVEKFGELLCFYARDLEVSLKANARPMCTRSTMSAHKDDLQDGLRAYKPGGQHDSGKPAITVNKYGKGQVIYIAGDVGGAFMNSPYPPLMRFVVGLVKQTPPPVEIEAPQTLEVTMAHRPSGELMIHLINNPTPLIPWRIANDEDMDRLGPDMSAFNAVLELDSLRNIRVRFNNLKVKSARLPLQGLDLEIKDGTVVVPEVKLHEVLLIS